MADLQPAQRKRVLAVDRQPVEVSHSSIYATLDKTMLQRGIVGALQDTINQHGPITSAWVGSATKRIVAYFRTADAKMGCPYCRERMRVNVGLLMENAELRRRLWGNEEGSAQAEPSTDRQAARVSAGEST